MSPSPRPALTEVRNSPIAGRGVFAARTIRKGTRILEYTGERISHGEASRRYDDDKDTLAHVVLFTVDRRTVIDGGVEGGDARFVNHSCAPNCEAQNEDGRIFIFALRTIHAGEELSYDYRLQRPGQRDAQVEARYACHCGAAECRGTMLEAEKRRRRGRN
jgi:SET domain-containing protein